MSFSSRSLGHHSRSFFEPLESRQLLSAGSTSELLDFTGQNTYRSGTLELVNSAATSSLTNNSLTMNYATLATATATPALPNMKRNYLGDAFHQKHVKLALVIKIRIQDNRGSYASLRG